MELNETRIKSIRNIVETTETIKEILDSLIITTKKLKDSDWSNRKKDLKTFTGPLLSPTRRKVTNLRRQFDGGMHTLLYMAMSIQMNKQSVTGHLKKLIEENNKNRENISVYYGDILIQLSRSKESDIYSALIDNKKKKPQQALDKLYNEIINLHRIITTLNTHASNVETI